MIRSIFIVVSLLCGAVLSACSVDSKFVGDWRAKHQQQIARLEIRSDGAAIIHWRGSQSSAAWKTNKENHLELYSRAPIGENDKPIVIGKIINDRLITTGKLTSDKSESLAWIKRSDPASSSPYFVK